MKISVTISMLSFVMLTAAGPTSATEPIATQAGEELNAPSSFLVIGRITQIDAQGLLVQDDGEAPVRVEVTADTDSPGSLMVGDQVMVSLNQHGKAAVITRGRIEAETSLLDESVRDAR